MFDSNLLGDQATRLNLCVYGVDDRLAVHGDGHQLGYAVRELNGVYPRYPGRPHQQFPCFIVVLRLYADTDGVVKVGFSE